jgi:hypothetical protein
VQFKKDLEDLKQQKENNSEITLERIKNIFLYPIQAKKEFEIKKNNKQEIITKTLLWNAQFRNKKSPVLTLKSHI